MSTPGNGKRSRWLIGAVGLAAGVVLGGYGIAGAATGKAKAKASTATTRAAAAAGLPGGPGGPGHGADVTAAAKAIGMSEADLATALEGGQTIAQVAKAKGVDVQKVIDALVAEDQARIAADVTSGRLTQAQADQLKGTLTQHATDEANGTFHGHGGPGGPGGPGHGADVTAAAKAIGMSEADLATALEGGQTIAQVAKAKGVDVQKVIDALVAKDQARIAADVTSGRLTQAQADQLKGTLTQHATDEANGTFHGPGGHGPGFGPGGPGFGRTA